MPGLLSNPFPGLGVKQQSNPDLLSQIIQNRNDPLGMLAALRAGQSSQSAPSSSSGGGDDSPAADLKMPDSRNAMDYGSHAAARDAGLHANGPSGGSDTSSGGAAGLGALGIHPGLINLAKSMMPTQDDDNAAMAKAGFTMAATPGSNFGATFAKGALAGVDQLQEMRQKRAEWALKQAELESQDRLRQSQEINFARQAFAGNFPYVVAAARKSGMPMSMSGPMGTPILVSPDGSYRDAPQAGAASAPPPQAPPGGAPPMAPNGGPPAPPAPNQTPQSGGPPLAAPIPSAAPNVAPPNPYAKLGVTNDAYDAANTMAGIMGPAGDVARKQMQEWATSTPAYKGEVAGTEGAAKAKYETVEVLDPSGNFTTTVPKDKWLAGFGKNGPPPPSAPPPASLGGQAPPAQQLPTLDSKTLGVKQVIPDAPTGGGFPVVPPNAKGMTAGTEQMYKDAAEVPKQWADSAKSLDVSDTRLRSLAHMYKLTETNEWADAKTEVAANLKEIYKQLDLPFTVGTDTFGDPAAAQIAIKNATIAAFEQARQYTNRITNMELQGQTKTVATPDLQPQAVYNIVMNGIATVERGRQMMNGWNDAQKEGWKNPLAYEAAWYNSNPADAWVESASRRAGNFKGMPLPPKEELNTTAQYVLRDGRIAKWNGNGFTPVKKNYTDLDIPPVQGQ